MKLLLTSGGVTNPTIHAALERLLGRPVAECHALCVPTAQRGHPACGPASVQGLVAARSGWEHLSGLGWASLGVLELTALPSIGADRWLSWLREAVWVGVSAGSMAMSPRIGRYFVEWPGAPDDRTLGLVDFSIFPHLDLFQTNTMAHAERWAADIGGPAYAIDEQTAITVVDGSVEVVSEGRWRRFAA